MMSIEAGICRPQFDMSGLDKSVLNYPKVIVACTFVAVFLGAAVILGVHLNQLIDEFIFLAYDLTHNPFYFIYLITAIGFIFLILLSERKLAQFMLSIGKIYILAGLVGFIIFGPQTIGQLVSIVNLGLGISCITVGWLLQEYQQWLLVSRIITKRRETSCTLIAILKNSGFNKSIKFEMEQISAS
jgi:hypothetical protein